MIRLKRTRELRSLHEGFTGDGLRERLMLLVAAKIASGDGSVVWTGKIAEWGLMKPTLKQDSFNKCAYCEANTAAVAYGDVEHFRPKSIYWWLALCVDNYVYACQLCNQTYKRDVFPIEGRMLAAPKIPDKLPQKTAELNRLLGRICPDPARVNEVQLAAKWLREDADLPHPYLEDPEPLFAWAVVETNQEVRLVPADSASPRAKRAVAAAEDYLGLNREQLRAMRYQIFAALRMAVQAWKLGDRELRRVALEQIRFMCESSQQFAGMCRYFARQAGVPL